MGATRTPRARWVEEGLRALATGGPGAVRVEALAQTLGVTKGGFYGYFRNRDALLAEMLDTWEREVTEGVIEQVEQGAGDERARLDRLFSIVAESGGVLTGTTLDLAVRDWARRDTAVAERLRRVDNRRMDYLRSLYRAVCQDEADVEARCLLTFALRIGNPFIVADHPGRSRTEVLRLTREWLLR